ncbi:MAG: YdeI/OmpD-associated family protein [Kofleriaceae bacterium]
MNKSGERPGVAAPQGWKVNDKPLHLTDRAAWTAWLETNHATAPEVTLVFHKKHSRTPCVAYAEAVEEALCFGWIDGIVHRLDDDRYTHRFTPRRKTSVWSDINKARIAALEEAGKIRPAGQKVIDEARASGAWEKPWRAVMPDEMPAELVAAFAKSKKARAAYDALPPGQQRDWQRWVHQAKQDETRVRRATKAVATLADGGPHPWLLGRVDEKKKEAARQKKKATSRRRGS